jgi:GntR family transcriptional regulator
MSNRARFGAAQRVCAALFDLHKLSGPLHEQVRELILARIERGDWSAGAPIPPEVQLAREFGVSIGTVRKALDQLARDRVLVRERGRGTFVKAGEARRTGPALRLCGADGRLIEPEIALVGTEYAVATPAEVAALRMVRPAAIVPRALKLRREWRHHGTLIAIETITVDAARFPNLQFEFDPAAEVLFSVYAEKYHAAVDRTLWTMQPLAGSDALARRLRGDGDAPVVRCVRTAFDARDAPLEISEQLVLFDGRLSLMASQ